MQAAGSVAATAPWHLPEEEPLQQGAGLVPLPLPQQQQQQHLRRRGRR